MLIGDSYMFGIVHNLSMKHKTKIVNKIFQNSKKYIHILFVYTLDKVIEIYRQIIQYLVHNLLHVNRLFWSNTK